MKNCPNCQHVCMDDATFCANCGESFAPKAPEPPRQAPPVPPPYPGMHHCRQCGNTLPPGAAVCINCGVPAGAGNAFCANCGNQTYPNAVVCVRCGVPLAPPAPPMPIPGVSKSKVVAGVLGILLGALGIHNFYLGYTGKALAQLLITVLTCGVGAAVTGIWGVVEGILILVGNINVDGKGIPLSQ